jgi:peptidoglycan/LPS O-acetylase OafA/YrhL
VSGPPPSPRRELAEGTALGTIYVRRLRRKQLALSLLALVAFAGLVGALPLVLYLVPSLHDVDVLGVPLSAALVLVPPFVAFVALAILYERRADDLEDAFREVVDPR